jgi:cytochrome c oxidase subunit 4
MSEHTVSSPEITFVHEPSDSTKKIWQVFWVLSALTIIELTIGLIIYNIHKGENPNETLVLAFKGMVCILTLAKAYFIVSVFMHLGDEIRNLIMTILVPLCLFIWFLTAFLIDGTSWKELRNRYMYHSTNTEQTAPPAATEPGAKN